MKGSSVILNHVCIKMQGVDALNNISFNLQPTEHLSIIGASGSGKTTLAKAIAGQMHTYGTIDLIWDDSSFLQKKVLLVEQRNAFKNLSHTSDFYYQQRFNSFDASDSETVWQALIQLCPLQEEDIKSLLIKFGLEDRQQAPLIQLSSGENKRFQLIKAILSKSQILILDSPFTGLDSIAQNHLKAILHELASIGTKLIIITNAGQIPDCITHIAILQKGELKSYIAKADWNQDNDLQFAKQDGIDISSLPVTEENNNYKCIVNMQNVHVRYGEKIILDGINWRIEEGEKWWLKGPNGAGKSTLLSLINGDNPQAYKNEIYLFGKRRGTGESIWDIKSKIGFVSPELHAFYDKGTSCFNTIASGLFDTIGLFKKLSAQQRETVQVWIDILGLHESQHKALYTLSFSNQRIALLARALIKNPVLLILDEPCQGLDDKQREAFVTLINDVSEHFNKTLIYVSHYDNEIPGCITNILELKAGGQEQRFSRRQTAFAEMSHEFPF